jgi:hypothetical protein
VRERVLQICVPYLLPFGAVDAEAEVGHSNRYGLTLASRIAERRDTGAGIHPGDREDPLGPLPPVAEDVANRRGPAATIALAEQAVIAAFRDDDPLRTGRRRP